MPNSPSCTQRIAWIPKRRSAQPGRVSSLKSDAFSTLHLPAAHISLNEGVSRLGTDPVVLALRFSLLPAPCGGEGKVWEVSPHGRWQVQTLSTKTFLSAVLHPHSASSGAWGENAVVWQLRAGGLRFRPGEQEQVVQYALSHWSLVQTYFKAHGSRQGSYVLLLIFTSIRSTLSKSTQWDLCRVINRPQLSGLPLPCSQSFLLLTGYTWYSRILRLVFLLATTCFLSKEKAKISSFAGTLAHLFIMFISLQRANWAVDCLTGSWRRKSHQNRVSHLWNLMEMCS